MTSYLLRRSIQAVLVLIVLSFVSFGLMGLMPGDPLDVACAANPRCTPENLALMKEQLGLNQPVYVRYLSWAKSFASGDLGYSRIYRRPVAEILFPRLWNSAVLGFTSMFISLCIAIPIGVFSGLKPNSWTDYIINLFAFLGVSAPPFWLGLMFIIVFSVWLKVLPAGGVETIGVTFDSWWEELLDRLKYMILPVATLSCLTIAGWVRYTRASILEVMRMDYIRTARSKGLTEGQVVVRHGLRNAMIPIVTIVTLAIPAIASGAVITETIFAYQGVGKLLYDSIIGNDFNVAMCSFMITCVLVLAVNLFADVLYAWLDPRISYQ